jgi:hypothetical protein
MTQSLRRRELLTLLGGTAAAWPLAARAQQRERMRRIGWLASTPDRLNAFKRGLADLGWIEGRNLAFEGRAVNDDPVRLRFAAAELAALRPDLVFVSSSVTLLAMRRATGTIPIVFGAVGIPSAKASCRAWRSRAATLQASPETSSGSRQKI